MPGIGLSPWQRPGKIRSPERGEGEGAEPAGELQGSERDAERETGDRQPSRWPRKGAGSRRGVGGGPQASRARGSQSILSAAPGIENKCKHIDFTPHERSVVWGRKDLFLSIRAHF